MTPDELREAVARRVAEDGLGIDWPIPATADRDGEADLVYDCTDAALDGLRDGADAALWELNSTHHFHGGDCLCGFASAVSRARTEHLTGLAASALLGGPK